MRLVALFEDNPESAQTRRALEPEHLKFLETHHAEIPMAGGLREEQGGPYVGGLWVFEVANRARVVELIEQDPYYLACPRKYRLLVWGKALAHLQAMM
jgi:uncharacterized protein YciI